MRFTPALDTDAAVDEIATIGATADALVHDAERTTIELVAALTHCYDRSTLRINANVAPATHGEAVGEIAGSGSASDKNQRFALRQSPLTYVAANNPRGRESTLTVRVNDIAWREVPSLFAQPPAAHVYALRQQDDGTTVVQFGDGIEGARLPTASDNVRLSYRKGLGLAGNVRARTLTSLLSRPVGVKSAVNPLPAAGGEDPERLSDARRNAPNTVLTLDRAVSVLDYTDFARAFAGIAKAVAAWIPTGRARGMHITVAGAGGAAITADTRTHQSLLESLRGYGDALLPLTLQSFVSVPVSIGAKIAVHPDHETTRVLAAVEAAIRADFAFEARDFAMPITLDEVLASAHRVAGVVAVDVDALHRSDTAAGPAPEARLFPSPGTVAADGSVSPAELLTLDPQGLTLEVMT
jgi:predicted phage baseplate assembly protein